MNNMWLLLVFEPLHSLDSCMNLIDVYRFANNSYTIETVLKRANFALDFAHRSSCYCSCTIELMVM